MTGVMGTLAVPTRGMAQMTPDTGTPLLDSNRLFLDTRVDLVPAIAPPSSDTEPRVIKAPHNGSMVPRVIKVHRNSNMELPATKVGRAQVMAPPNSSMARRNSQPTRAGSTIKCSLLHLDNGNSLHLLQRKV